MDWDRYFMNIAGQVALKSKDRSTQVGCVIVGPDHEILATGYNGFPRGIDDDAPERHERPEKYFWTEHAERNAIYAAARIGTPLKGCTAYVTLSPCMDCARALVQVGVATIVCDEPDLTNPTWGEHFARLSRLFEEASVIIRRPA
ncbi:deoxycytidylate deaminase [Bosea thiooxidans]